MLLAVVRIFFTFYWCLFHLFFEFENCICHNISLSLYLGTGIEMKRNETKQLNKNVKEHNATVTFLFENLWVSLHFGWCRCCCCCWYFFYSSFVFCSFISICVWLMLSHRINVENWLNLNSLRWAKQFHE